MNDAPRDAVPPFKVGLRYTYEQTLMVRGGDHHFVDCRTTDDTEPMFLLVLGPAELAAEPGDEVELP